IRAPTRANRRPAKRLAYFLTFQHPITFTHIVRYGGASSVAAERRNRSREDEPPQEHDQSGGGAARYRVEARSRARVVPARGPRGASRGTARGRVGVERERTRARLLLLGRGGRARLACRGVGVGGRRASARSDAAHGGGARSTRTRPARACRHNARSDCGGTPRRVRTPRGAATRTR